MTKSGREVQETYRSLRATIQHAVGDQPVRSVLVVDVDRPESSLVGLNIAAAFSKAGDRCVLIDTCSDFRDGAQQVSLADAIRNPAAIDEIGTDEVGPTIVSPGAEIDSDLLATSGFGEAIRRFIIEFDHVIVTCNAYPKSGDAIAIAPVVDAVIVVVSAGVTGREPAIRARDALERVGARILGMVMIERPRRWF